MRILLDTHALYWFIEGASQLSKAAQTTISDRGNEVLLSPSSYWEIAIKLSMGRWQLNCRYEDFVEIGMKRYGFELLPILPKHTANLIGLPFHHKDPFDRLLVAQASTEHIPIVSVDAQLDAYGVTRIW